MIVPSFCSPRMSWAIVLRWDEYLCRIDERMDHEDRPVFCEANGCAAGRANPSGGEDRPAGQIHGDGGPRALPEIPSHIHLIGALDNVNTYDLIEIADLGLAYTTTVGVETAMNGIPVISCGQTHYRGRGFTIDPNTWDEYFSTLEKVLSDLPDHRLTEEQTAKAWNYAYRFFFEYPRPFPWRLMNFWDDLEVWPVEKVLSDEGCRNSVIRSVSWSANLSHGKIDDM